MKMKSQSEVAQSCATLSDPMDGGAYQTRVLEWGTIAFSELKMAQLSRSCKLSFDIFPPLVLLSGSRLSNWLLESN